MRKSGKNTKKVEIPASYNENYGNSGKETASIILLFLQFCKKKRVLFSYQ